RSGPPRCSVGGASAVEDTSLVSRCDRAPALFSWRGMLYRSWLVRRTHFLRQMGRRQRVFGKWGLFVLAALASAAVLTSSAGAVTQGSAGPNLSTRAGVVQYLASHGIDARGIVVQRGSRNYAGPNCPGKGWTCTTATRVLQSGTTNQYTCTASTGGTVN